MLYANSPDNQKITASPNSIGTCPYCQKELVPKCGSINIHHWAHKSILDCDSWYEPETDWHLGWKTNFPKEQVEIPLSLMGKKHIADWFNQSKMKTIEFQYSPISIDDRLEREAFYPGLTWVYGNVNPDHLIEYVDEDFQVPFTKYWWKHPKKSLLYGLNKKCNYFIDEFPHIGEMFYIDRFEKRKHIETNPFGTKISYRHIIEGMTLSRTEFIERTIEYGDWCD
jgi:hypothetical protein